MKMFELLITLLVIGGFAAGLTGFYGALASEYGASYHNFSTIDQSASVYADVNSTLQIVNTSQSEDSANNVFTTAPGNYLLGAFKAGMMILKTPTYFYAIITDLMGIVGLPSWVGIMVIGIISIIIAALIIDFITGRQSV